jgi:hypothetical protein
MVQPLKEQLKMSDEQIRERLSILVKKAVKDLIETNDSAVFTQEEAKELEEDLKGLGYI